jgi:lysophospholipase L1-like esterase
MGAIIPPRIGNIPGLPEMLANQGWQVLTDRPECQTSAFALTMTTVAPGALNAVTVRLAHRALFDASHIVLVWGTYWKNNVAFEAPGRNVVFHHSALQRMGSSYSDETGPIVEATYKGQRMGLCSHRGLLFSDPIPFEVAAGEVFWTRDAAYTGGPSYFLSGYQAVRNDSTGAEAIDLKEGVIAGDLVTSGTVGQGGSLSYPPGGPVMILGFNKNRQKSCALFGDSIGAGTFDGGFGSVLWGGYLVRLMRNVTARVQTSALAQTTVSNFPFVHCAQGGQTAATVATQGLSAMSVRLAEFCTTVIWQLGVNDIAGAPLLSTMQSNLLRVAGWFAARGKKFIACTIIPQTTSTDGWLTVANQTVLTGETLRTGYNSWLRDTGPNGFVAQAGGPSVADIFDAAATIEVNSAGVPALNGGFWPAALSASLFSGSITNSPTTSSFIDSSQTAPNGTYRGCALKMTSGAASGQIVPIISQNSGGAYVFSVSFSTAPSVGDTYVIPDVYTREGLHPITLGYKTIANGLMSQLWKIA